MIQKGFQIDAKVDYRKAKEILQKERQASLSLLKNAIERGHFE